MTKHYSIVSQKTKIFCLMKKVLTTNQVDIWGNLLYLSSFFVVIELSKNTQPY